jgi:hypothetical protein
MSASSVFVSSKIRERIHVIAVGAAVGRHEGLYRMSCVRVAAIQSIRPFSPSGHQ